MPKPKEQPDPKEVSKEADEVVVELDEKNEAVKAPVKEEPKYVRPEDLNEALRKSNAAFFAEQRKLQARLDEIARQTAPKTPAETEKPADEWDKKIQEDWKGTVRELARIEAADLRKKERAEEDAQREQTNRMNLLESNKKKVLEKYPDINEPGSERAVAFESILRKNPEYLSNPFGPVLAMRDLEDEMRQNGAIDEPTRQVVQKEVQRVARTNGTSLPAGSSAAGNQKITLSKDEKEFCDHNNIKYENYAKNKKIFTTSREVTV